MKTLSLFLIIVTFFCTAICYQTSGQNSNHRNLTYIESSSGLNFPDMEGGRTEIEFADINGDGHVDILSIGDHGSPYINTNQHGIMVWFGDGTGTWSVFQNGNFGYGGIAIGDVNNDGLLDVGYGMHHNYSGTDFGDQLIEVALGDGTGMNWVPWDDGLATNGESWGMFGTDFADIDNDGDLDLGSVSFGSGAGVHVYVNNFDGTWTQSFGFVEGNSTMIFEFGDINNDGYMDFGVTQQDGSVYFGDGTGNFEQMDINLPPLGNMGRYGVSLGDVDNNGGKDLAFINSTGGIEVWVWSNPVQQWISYSGTLPSAGDYEMTQLCDMNVDVYMDMAAYGEGTFTLWLGDGQGNWSLETQFTTPPYGYCEAFRAGSDVDHNGFPDMIMVTREGTWPNDLNHLHCYKESSTAETLTIKALAPAGYNNLRQGTVQFIDWISAVPGNNASTVKLEYSVNGLAGPWLTIATNLLNNGRYQWIVPGANSQDCYIKYTVCSGADSAFTFTPSPFTILGTTGNEELATPNPLININCYPNPFHNQINIILSLQESGQAQVEIIDLFGRPVTPVCDAFLTSGNYILTWDGRSNTGLKTAPGAYIVSVKVNHQSRTKCVFMSY